MSYLFYFPGRQHQDKQHFRSAGIGWLVENYDLPGMINVAKGPDDGPGVVSSLASIMENPPVAYSPDVQHWRPANADSDHDLAAGRYWVGVDVRFPIDPRRVERWRVSHAGGRKIFDGIPVKLGDGQAWTIPIARMLPHIYAKGDNGAVNRNPEHEFNDFCRRSEMIFANAYQARGVNFIVTDIVNYCIAALQLNYRLAEEVIELLGLLTDETIPAITGATIELDLVKTVVDQKKSSEPATTPAT